MSDVRRESNIARPAGQINEMTPGARLTGRSRTITEADLVSFAALTGDWHPQHSDAEWAAESRFGERIAHGMLVLSYSIGLLGFDPERVVALRGLDSVTFKRPVAIGETIRVEADVEEATPLDDGHELVTLRWRVLSGDRLAVRARVQVVHRTPAEVANGNAAEPGLTVTAEGLYGDRVLL
jgi:3-hydroxybutyryl-CoA dehydratase